MTDNPESNLSQWKAPLQIVSCAACGCSFFITANSPVTNHCPNCHRNTLSPYAGDVNALPYVRPPELHLPYSLSPAGLSQAIQNFSAGIPFAPPDLNEAGLRSRLQSMYLPMWLVDCNVSAQWKAKTGYNYQVISHQDHYAQNEQEWKSKEVRETRLRWEPRLGLIERSYHNTTAPALEENARLMNHLGAFDLNPAQPYQPEVLQKAAVRLPNRLPQDAWTDAASHLNQIAAQQCRQACGADRIEEFSWTPAYSEQNWTLLLLPVYSTYYLDDEGIPRQVLIHGQTGKIMGQRRASIQRAQKAASIAGVIALAILVLSIVLGLVSLVFPPLLAAAILGIVVAVLVAIGAGIALATAYQFNSSQETNEKT